MKSKLLTLILMTAFLSLALISAADLISVSKGPVLSKTNDATYFEVTAIADVDLTSVPSILSINDSEGRLLTVSLTSLAPSLDATNKSKVDVAITNIEDNFNFDLMTYNFPQLTITATNDLDPTDTEAETVILQFLNTFCEEGNIQDTLNDNRYLEIRSIKDKSSTDDWEWKPLDEVEIDIKVKFNSDDEDDDIDGMIEIALYDTEENDFVELDNDDEDLEIDFTADEGETITETVILKIPVEDLDDSSTRYKLYVKVYEEDDEDKICRDYEDSDYFTDIKLSKESYDVILPFEKIELTTPAPCGEEIELSVKAYNIGNNDEEKVLVTLYNTALGIDLQEQIIDLDEGDAETVHFNFIVPEGTDEKNYDLILRARFRYKESSDSYREDSELSYVPLKIEGNCIIETENAVITAQLDSETPEAIAGKQVIIQATVRNIGDLDTTYSLSLTGNSAWSSLVAIDPQTININAGDSKEVIIYLDLDSDAQGDKEFTIKATSTNGVVIEQNVAFTIEEGVTKDAILSHLQDNWFIYVIVIVNLILIIAIIAVIKRMASRPATVM